jgi:hypothetical protein
MGRMLARDATAGPAARRADATFAVVLFFPFLSACAGDHTSEAAEQREVVSIRIEPAQTTLVVSPGAPLEQQYKVIGTFGNGDEDVLDLVSWELSNVSIGEIDSRGIFTSVDTNGGASTVTAQHLDLVATADLTVVYAEDLSDDDVDATIPAAFAAADPIADGSVALLYPFDGATIPRNLRGLRFGWEGADDDQISRLRFTSGLTDISAYTFGSSWEVPVDVWQTITATNRRGEVDVVVEVGDWSAGALSNVRTSEPISHIVNRLDATGSVTYWSSYDGQIMRVKAGETEANRFYPLEESDDCYGCHSISEKRQWMVVTRDGIDGQYRVLDVNDPDNPVMIFDLMGDKRMTFRTLSPDGEWMLGVDRGKLLLYDLATNTQVDAPELDGSLYCTPDWAPGGDQVVAVRLQPDSFFNSDLAYDGGEIVLIPWNGAELGEPQVLVPWQEGMTQYYPAFSPDGRFVVFNRSTGDSYADPDAELWLVDALGGEPVRLDAANGVELQQNSLARWAPLPDDEVLWLAYSSKRPYPLEDDSVSQIWITAIDPTLFDAGEDPSSAPVWLPGQRPDSDNHVPLWWTR